MNARPNKRLQRTRDEPLRKQRELLAESQYHNAVACGSGDIMHVWPELFSVNPHATALWH